MVFSINGGTGPANLRLRAMLTVPQHPETHAYRPGESAPTTGIYRVRHNQHRSPHDVTISVGAVFPTCKKCDGEVRFILIRTAQDIGRDTDFQHAAS